MKKMVKPYVYRIGGYHMVTAQPSYSRTWLYNSVYYSNIYIANHGFRIVLAGV